VKIYNNLSNFKATNPVVTIGMFDGVHIGHRAIIEQLQQKANAIGGETVLLTFWPHPRMFFEGSSTSLKLLTTIEEKTVLLETVGVNHLIVLPFTQEFTHISPYDFVKTILVDGIGAKEVVVGYDHRFGHKGAGDFMLLKTLGAEFGFFVNRLEAVEQYGLQVSSTKIREALLAGDVLAANAMLGSEYVISGTVVRGDQIGRTINFPTANCEPSLAMKLIPQNGIYIVQVLLAHKRYNGVLNIGIRPTVTNVHKRVTIEVFILDFDADIYGQDIQIILKQKIRDEAKFATLGELQQQIQFDVAETRTFFGLF